MTILMTEYRIQRAKHCKSSVLGTQPKGSKINAFCVNESDVDSVDEPVHAVRMRFHRTLYLQYSFVWIVTFLIVSCCCCFVILATCIL